ncbi:cellulase [Aureococcus anophagefferens]|uniref:Cellulase n=1 Tax=Aureococcus anophagefferens TaxID=44056 RepID=A0ABR1G4L0_AURAN
MRNSRSGSVTKLLLLLTTATAFEYDGFAPLHDSKTCASDAHLNPWNEKLVGVNLGSLFVLEPWITPSLFYQFLGGKSTTTAMDTHSFCEVLGGDEANAQLRRHWDHWVTDDVVARLAATGVNSLRLPVGDYQFAPYGPYKTCFKGSLKRVDAVLDMAHRHNLSVLLDVHAVRGSQNGFDNGGETVGLAWTSTVRDLGTDAITFEHWPRRSAAWMGNWNKHTGLYDSIDYANLNFTLDVLGRIADRYADHPAVLGIEPVNEPWNWSPLDILKDFYWRGYLTIKRRAPKWRYVIHDSFRFTADAWGGFMRGCPDIAIDTHIYQAWMDPGPRLKFYVDACQQKAKIAELERAFGPVIVIVGEWSLATDNCAMWLNGFNDNLPGYPKLPCKYVPCAEPYMGKGQPRAPPDRSKPLQGPFGTGVSGPIYGQCPVDRDWPNALLDSDGDGVIDRLDRLGAGNALTGNIQNPQFDDTDAVMTALASKKLLAFKEVAHGFYFWNFRNELEPSWSWLAARDAGWLAALDDSRALLEACASEDAGADVYACVAKNDLPDQTYRDGMAYCVGYDEAAVASFKALHNDTLRDRATEVFAAYWGAHFATGATCDFGGAAKLVLRPEGAAPGTPPPALRVAPPRPALPRVIAAVAVCSLALCAAALFSSLVSQVVSRRSSFRGGVGETSFSELRRAADGDDDGPPGLVVEDKAAGGGSRYVFQG